MLVITNATRARRIGGGAALALVAATLTAGLPAEAAHAKAEPIATTTTLAITPPSVAYGDSADAVATVVAAPAAPGAKRLGGDASFTVNGQTIVGKVTGNDGQATVGLPETLPAGHAYPVVATFVPEDPTAYVASTSAAAQVLVVRDNTSSTVKVPNLAKGQRIKADVKVVSAHKQTVTGKVTVILKRKGKILRTKTKVLADGARTVGLGRAKKRGGYTVKVKYLGDVNFNPSRVKTRFTVS